MAKGISQDKRNAILEAATRIFAARGLSAPTAAISGEAGIAEGTLFSYFNTKDELLNALYREIKVELADAMMSGFPRKRSIRFRLEHVWNHYVDWGVGNPQHHRVLRLLEAWNGLTGESQQAGVAPFVEVRIMMEEAQKQGTVKDLPQRFFIATLNALAETVIELARQEPEWADNYRRTAFEMLWAGVTRR